MNVSAWLVAVSRIVWVSAFFVPTAANAVDWTPIPVVWPSHGHIEDRMVIGAEDPNPFVALPTAIVRGRWIRFSAIAAEPESGINLAINVYRGNELISRTPPSRCEEGKRAIRCSAAVWVPIDTDRVVAVIWASEAAGEISSPEVAVSAGDPPSPSETRFNVLLEEVQTHYYRTDEVDWVAITRDAAAIPLPPGDVDPVASVAQWLRYRLPEHKHTHVALSAHLETRTTDASVPT